MRYSLVRSALRRDLVQKTHLPLPVRKISTAPDKEPFEEEKAWDYHPESYYPARIGETLKGKYQLVSKLGWGTGSTVWLAKTSSWFPWQKDTYAALKITNNTPVKQAAARKELGITKQVFAAKTSHPGRQFIRGVLDSFEVQGPDGTHIVLALEPLRQPLSMLAQQDGLTKKVPVRTIKAVLPSILQSLDYLHSEAGIIHTGKSIYLKADHFMIPFEDTTVLDEYVMRQEANPAPCIDRNGRPIYVSRSNFGQLRGTVENVKLTDFGLAVRGSQPNNHDIQPREYTAPEVLLKADWTYSVDVWNLALVLFDLLGEVNLFSGRSKDHPEFSNKTRFAQIIRLLGPLPSELRARADETKLSKYFNEHGEYKYPELIPDESFNFESKTSMLEGQDRELFINFVRRMLTWVPEQRATTKELLDDPWLKYRSREEM
ncbi:hypothetical protein NW762_007647 [Fusarium torreyae]|uniref:non-specific serine/threonine protein kinase n=1 Tax=Fusarium torreyae TaxID=1237075 RepID=A0A9W8VDN8_9HYPO|nr:hypothetical protein NW762_007647 [Fusarium torreyae]